MKIDYVANLRLPTYRAHGVQITKMCEEFASLGHDVRLLVPAKRHTIGGTDDPFEVYGLKRNFTLCRVPALDLLGRSFRFGNFFYWLDLFSFMVSLALGTYVRGDSVLYVRDPFLLAPFARRRCIVEVHELPGHPGAFYRRLARADVIVALTESLKSDLIQKGVDANRIVVAPDGVDLDQFAHPESKEAARARLGLPQEDTLALYIGRLDGWKGVGTFYAAADLLWPAIKAVVIGGDDQEVTELRQKHPHVTFLGNRPYRELADNQAAADVLVLPNTAKNATSARHTSPLKLFAYMASGVPIVASDLPSIGDVLSECNAFLVEPDNAQALAAGITRAVQSPDSKERAARARADVESYAWTARAQKIIAALPHD